MGESVVRVQGESLAERPPWLATYPPTYAPDDFPAYVAPRGPMSLRAQNSARMLAEHDDITFETFVDLKLSTYALLTERVLDKLLRAASTSDDPDVAAGASLLAGWNRYYDEDNRAGLLFEEWAALFAGESFSGQQNYARPWSLDEPLTTPSGLKDPVQAVAMLKQAVVNTRAKYGRLDPRFGDVSRFELDGLNIAGHGGFGNLGVFRVITWSPLNAQQQRTPLHGETWVAMIEFSEPVGAWGLMSYGNSRQAGTSHYNDQLELLANDQFRPLFLSRAEVEANTVETVAF